MKITLTSQQKLQLDHHDSTRDGRVRDRIKAVLLASEDWSQAMISQALRIHESTVARHNHTFFILRRFRTRQGSSKLVTTF